MFVLPEIMASSGYAPNDSVSNKVTEKMSVLGLKLYVVIAIVAIVVIAVSLLIFLRLRYKRKSRKRQVLEKRGSGLIPLVSKEIVEIKGADRVEEIKIGEIVKGEKEVKRLENMSSDKEAGDEIDGPKRSEESDLSRESRSEALSVVTVEAQNIGWGRWYSLRELEMATNGFVEENVIGEGGYGVVYRGVLPDGSVVAVKNLLNNK